MFLIPFRSYLWYNHLSIIPVHSSTTCDTVYAYSAEVLECLDDDVLHEVLYTWILHDVQCLTLITHHTYIAKNTSVCQVCWGCKGKFSTGLHPSCQLHFIGCYGLGNTLCWSVHSIWLCSGQILQGCGSNLSSCQWFVQLRCSTSFSLTAGEDELPSLVCIITSKPGSTQHSSQSKYGSIHL